jgi:hypothetical protein
LPSFFVGEGNLRSLRWLSSDSPSEFVEEKVDVVSGRKPITNLPFGERRANVSITLKAASAFSRA